MDEKKYKVIEEQLEFPFMREEYGHEESDNPLSGYKEISLVENDASIGEGETNSSPCGGCPNRRRCPSVGACE